MEPDIHPVKKGHGDEVTFKFKKENFDLEKGTKTTGIYRRLIFEIRPNILIGRQKNFGLGLMTEAEVFH